MTDIMKCGYCGKEFIPKPIQKKLTAKGRLAHCSRQCRDRQSKRYSGAREKLVLDVVKTNCFRCNAEVLVHVWPGSKVPRKLCFACREYGRDTEGSTHSLSLRV